MYADLGKVDQAIALLGAGPDGATSRPAKSALLAQLYRRAGRTSDAAAEYQKVLADPASPVDSLAAGAEFYARLKQPDVAEQFLARIEKSSLAPGGVELTEPKIRVRSSVDVPLPFETHRPTLSASLPTQLDHAALSLRQRRSTTPSHSPSSRFARQSGHQLRRGRHASQAVALTGRY